MPYAKCARSIAIGCAVIFGSTAALPVGRLAAASPNSAFLIADPVHSTALQTRDPRLRDPFKPSYPRLELRQKQSALVIVQFTVSEGGKVQKDSITFLGTNPTDAFKKAVIRSLGYRTYKPALRNGRAVAKEGHHAGFVFMAQAFGPDSTYEIITLDDAAARDALLVGRSAGDYANQITDGDVEVRWRGSFSRTSIKEASYGEAKFSIGTDGKVVRKSITILNASSGAADRALRSVLRSRSYRPTVKGGKAVTTPDYYLTFTATPRTGNAGYRFEIKDYAPKAFAARSLPSFAQRSSAKSAADARSQQQPNRPSRIASDSGRDDSVAINSSDNQINVVTRRSTLSQGAGTNTASSSDPAVAPKGAPTREPESDPVSPTANTTKPKQPPTLPTSSAGSTNQPSLTVRRRASRIVSPVEAAPNAVPTAPAGFSSAAHAATLIGLVPYANDDLRVASSSVSAAPGSKGFVTFGFGVDANGRVRPASIKQLVTKGDPGVIGLIERGLVNLSFSTISIDGTAVAFPEMYRTVAFEVGGTAARRTLKLREMDHERSIKMIRRRDPSTSFNLASTSFKPKRQSAANYPRRAAQRGIEGSVTLSFAINQQGRVIPQSITVADASPTGYFEREAKKALAKFVYEPLVVDGRPVQVNGLRYNFGFRLQ